MAYATKHVVWNELKWSKVFFSDESKFNIFNSYGRIHVRRRSGERVSPQCAKKTVKFGGSSVMAWSVISASVVGFLVQLHGRVNAEVYKQLLDQHVIPYLRLAGQNSIFYAR